MKLQNPEKKTLKEEVFSSFTLETTLADVKSAMKLQNLSKKTLREAFCSFTQEAPEDLAMAILKSDEKSPVKKEDKDLLQDGNKVKKISSVNVFESDGNCLNKNLVSENGKKEDETQEFLVGNLVWVMNKYKKWWPGEVIGYKAKGQKSFKIRYIGQNQFVFWCASSKLEPFKESFEKMVNRQTEKGFFVAVEKAMNLLGNSLKLDMTCSCIAKEKKIQKTKALILREFSIDRLEPKEFLTHLKELAKCDQNVGRLEMTVMKTRLSSFYNFFGCKQMTMEELQEPERRKRFTAAKMKQSKFIGYPSIVAGTCRRRFMKQWFRKFVSEVDNVSAKEDIAKMVTSDLMSKLKLLALDYKSSEEIENIGVFEWFFSKFRISEFLDENAYEMQLTNMAGLKDKAAKPRTKQRTFKSDNEQKDSMSMNSRKKRIKSSVQSPEKEAFMAETLRTPPVTLLPDLNKEDNGLDTAEFNNLQRPETPRTTMLNFQVLAPCSTSGFSRTQSVSNQPNFINVDLISSGKKKRVRKRKVAEEVPVLIPDLNGIATEADSIPPQSQPRRRRKKEQLTNGITILILKFTSKESMPSRDDLTSIFSSFGPLDSSETYLSEEVSYAQVAFVSSGDAIEAVKSLEKTKPFGETLVSFRLQQKLINVQRNIAFPRMPVISEVSLVPKPNNTPMSVDSMKQNLMMMTAMLEKSGDGLSGEIKAKLKSEITGLMEKIGSMPGSSSS